VTAVHLLCNAVVPCVPGIVTQKHRNSSQGLHKGNKPNISERVERSTKMSSLSPIALATNLDWLAGWFPVPSHANFASGMLQCHTSICWRYFLEAVAGHFLKGILQARICSFFVYLFVRLFVHSLIHSVLPARSWPSHFMLRPCARCPPGCKSKLDEHKSV